MEKDYKKALLKMTNMLPVINTITLQYKRIDVTSKFVLDKLMLICNTIKESLIFLPNICALS